MLIFDNIIFNSFVPQGLMVLMFLHCCVSVFLSNIAEFQSDVPIDFNDAIVYEQTALFAEGTANNKSISFFDVIQAEQLLPLDETIHIQLPEVPIYYTPYLEVNHSVSYQNFFFSRPPPTA